MKEVTPKTAANILANIDELLHPEHPDLQDLEIGEQAWLIYLYAWVEVCLSLEDIYSGQLMKIYIDLLTEFDVLRVVEALQKKRYPDTPTKKLISELVEEFPDKDERVEGVRKMLLYAIRLLEKRGVLNDED